MHRTARWLLIACLLAFLFSRTASTVVDPDLWHELASAREVLETKSLPWQDHFAYTPTLPIVVHHEWGAGLIALLMTRAFGPAGLLVLKFTLIYGLASVCWMVARRRCGSVIVTGVIAGLAIVLGDHSLGAVRAQMYSYLFTALLLLGLEYDRAGSRRWLIGLFVLFPVWVNLHGGCLVGAALLGAYWLEQLLRRQPHWHLFFAGLALVPLTALNPWGWHYHIYLARAILMSRPRIAEWAPLWVEGELHHWLAFGVAAGLTCRALIPFPSPPGKEGRREGRSRQIPVLLLIATGLAALKSNRFMAIYAIVCACYLPAVLGRMELGKDLRRWWYKYPRVLCAVLAAATLALVGKGLLHEPWRVRVPSVRASSADHTIYPVGAVNYLAGQNFSGNVLVPFDWGSYVMWKLGPRVQISSDTRYEVAYPDWRLDEDFLFFDAGAGWEQILEKYPTDVVLLPVSLKVARKVADLPGWKAVYRDSQFAIFARAGLELPPVISDVDPPDGEYP
jgi:hypothetical protein